MKFPPAALLQLTLGRSDPPNLRIKGCNTREGVLHSMCRGGVAVFLFHRRSVAAVAASVSNNNSGVL